MGGSTGGIIKKPNISFISLQSARNLYAPLLKDHDPAEIWEMCAFESAPQPVSNLKRLILQEDTGPPDGNFRSKCKTTIVSDRTTRSQSISGSKASHSSETTQTEQVASQPVAAARPDGSEPLWTPAIAFPSGSSTAQVANRNKLPRLYWSLTSLKVPGAVELKRSDDKDIEFETFYNDELERIGVKDIAGTHQAAHPPIVHSGTQSRVCQ
jgi:hypothetical protein